MSDFWGRVYPYILGLVVGAFLVYVLTLDEPKHDDGFECPKVILVADKPFAWHQLDSHIWWNEATPVGFSPDGSPYICLFTEET